MSKPRRKKKSPKRGLRLLPRACRDSSRTRRRIGRHPALRARSPIHVGGLSPFGLWPLGAPASPARRLGAGLLVADA